MPPPAVHAAAHFAADSALTIRTAIHALQLHRRIQHSNHSENSPTSRSAASYPPAAHPTRILQLSNRLRNLRSLAYCHATRQRSAQPCRSPHPRSPAHRAHPPQFTSPLQPVTASRPYSCRSPYTLGRLYPAIIGCNIARSSILSSSYAPLLQPLANASRNRAGSRSDRHRKPALQHLSGWQRCSATSIRSTRVHSTRPFGSTYAQQTPTHHGYSSPAAITPRCPLRSPRRAPSRSRDLFLAIHACRLQPFAGSSHTHPTNSWSPNRETLPDLAAANHSGCSTPTLISKLQQRKFLDVQLHQPPIPDKLALHAVHLNIAAEARRQNCSLRRSSARQRAVSS